MFSRTVGPAVLHVFPGTQVAVPKPLRGSAGRVGVLMGSSCGADVELAQGAFTMRREWPSASTSCQTDRNEVAFGAWMLSSGHRRRCC